MYYDLVESGKRIKAFEKGTWAYTGTACGAVRCCRKTPLHELETGNRGISIDLAIELVVRFDTTLDYIFLGRE